ncbi:MAG TPA: hypothetical protein VL738_41805 [Dactylosporangium sp.]|jgi:hypothetical protein|nr:hypothetical protein [Dactylosporangium sp.]
MMHPVGLVAGGVAGAGFVVAGTVVTAAAAVVGGCAGLDGRRGCCTTVPTAAGGVRRASRSCGRPTGLIVGTAELAG